jgi:hypothetical protein
VGTPWVAIPGELVAEAFPGGRSVAGGELAAVALTQQCVGGQDRIAGGGVVEQTSEGRADGCQRLVPPSPAAAPNTVRHPILQQHAQGAAAPSGGFSVEAQQQGVEAFTAFRTTEPGQRWFRSGFGVAR